MKSKVVASTQTLIILKLKQKQKTTNKRYFRSVSLKNILSYNLQQDLKIHVVVRN